MFDLRALQETVAREGRVARVVIAAHDGSSPRETGAAMLVWASGQDGTIGGGALEWEAVQRARAMLIAGGTRLDREALGPKLGQCCGGAVTVLSEVYDAASASALTGLKVIARPVDGSSGGEMPLAVGRLVSLSRRAGTRPPSGLIQGWMVEPVDEATRDLWIWGAGHVGRAIVSVLAPLPGFALTWVDCAADRFPAQMPAGVTALWAGNPADLVGHVPAGVEHLVLTYSHALDLELCHRLLTRCDSRIGLIGSATKRARFRSRLAALGHAPDAVARIRSPIGDPALGKHPQAIAIGVAAELLSMRGIATPATRRDEKWGQRNGD